MSMLSMTQFSEFCVTKDVVPSDKPSVNINTDTKNLYERYFISCVDLAYEMFLV